MPSGTRNVMTIHWMDDEIKKTGKRRNCRSCTRDRPLELLLLMPGGTFRKPNWDT